MRSSGLLSLPLRHDGKLGIISSLRAAGHRPPSCEEGGIGQPEIPSGGRGDVVSGSKEFSVDSSVTPVGAGYSSVLCFQRFLSSEFHPV